MNYERPVHFTVFGRELTLRVRPENEALMHRLVSMVNERVSRVRRNLPTESDVTTVILAGIILAEELLRSEQALAALKEDLEVELNELRMALDHALNPSLSNLDLDDAEEEEPPLYGSAKAA